MIGLNSSSRIAAFVVFILSLTLLCGKSPITTNSSVSAQASTCENGVGGRIFSAGGDVIVEILPCLAGFTSELRLFSPGSPRLIGTNHDTGTTVNLGSFPAGVELVFGIYVRETGRTYYSGFASTNPDGVGHGDVTCLNKGQSKIGFEDQFGGGDRNYSDLLCEVRQPLADCAFSISPSSQSFDTVGGNGTISIVAGSGCNWNVSTNASWISVNSGTGSASASVSYSVAPNQGAGSRSAVILLGGDTFTVYQDGLGAGPVILNTLREGKRLYLYGINFDSGSVILLNGEKQKTLHDENNSRTVIIGKKLAKWALPGDRIQVRTSTGVLSPEYIYEP
jgi:hypothetical protein